MTPALEQLRADAISLQAGALADSTKRQYGYFEVYWVRFLLVFQLLSFMLNPSEFVVLLYVAFLARSVQYAAVKHYLQGLQRFLRSQGWQGQFSQMWGLQQALTGLRRRAREVVRKLPITPYVLMQVLAVLNLQCDLQFMVFVAMLVAFGAFLRKSNLCAASTSITHVQRSLLRSDVVVDMGRYCLVVTLRFMKNAQFGDAAHTVVVSGRPGHPLDPVRWWCAYVTRVPAPASAAAFGYISGGEYVPLTHAVFVVWVKKLLHRAGIDPAGFAGHSFRRGAATYSFLVGLPELMIKELGAWRSQVYQVYMDLAMSHKLAVHQQWFNAMQSGQWGAELAPRG